MELKPIDTVEEFEQLVAQVDPDGSSPHVLFLHLTVGEFRALAKRWPSEAVVYMGEPRSICGYRVRITDWTD